MRKVCQQANLIVLVSFPKVWTKYQSCSPEASVSSQWWILAEAIGLSPVSVDDSFFVCVIYWSWKERLNDVPFFCVKMHELFSERMFTWLFMRKWHHEAFEEWDLDTSLRVRVILKQVILVLNWNAPWLVQNLIREITCWEITLYLRITLINFFKSNKYSNFVA